MFNNTTKATFQIKFFRRKVTLFRIVYENIYGGCAPSFQRKHRHLHVHFADHFITIIGTYLVQVRNCIRLPNEIKNNSETNRTFCFAVHAKIHFHLLFAHWDCVTLLELLLPLFIWHESQIRTLQRKMIRNVRTGSACVCEWMRDANSMRRC